MTTGAPRSPGLDNRGLAAALVTVVLWASAFVGIRDLADTFSPGSITIGRLAIGAVVLGLLVARRGWQGVPRRAGGFIVASGLVWFALYNLALNEAEHHIDAGTASMLVNTGPIFLAAFAGVFLGEGFPRRLVAGLAVAFAGALIMGLSTSGDARSDQAFVPLGIALCIVSAVAYATGVTLQKPALAHVSALQVTWLACLTGLVACLPFMAGFASEVARVAASDAATAKLGWLAYLGLFPTSIAFTTWAYALGRTSAGRLGVMTYLIPPVAIVLARLLLGEVPPLLAVAGGVLCLAGVVIVRTPRLGLGARLVRIAARE